MSILKRREISHVIYVLTAVIILLAEYTNLGALTSSKLMIAVTMIVNFTIVLGFYNLVYRHVNIITRQQKPDMYYSLVLIITFVVNLATMYLWEPGFQWILAKIFMPVMIAITLGGFTLITMLYRGARVRDWVSLVIMVTAIIVALSKSAIGMLIPPLYITGDWILAVPNMSARRAITILAGLGTIILFIRGLLGLERSYMGETSG